MDGTAIPLFTANVTTFLHDFNDVLISLAKSGSNNNDFNFGFFLYAAVILSKNCALIIHPPFHMDAILPKFKFQLFFSPTVLIKFIPCVYDIIFDAYNALRISSITAFLFKFELSCFCSSNLINDSNSILSALYDDKNRAFNAAPIVGIATACINESRTVHIPVPFCPVLSNTLSTKYTLLSLPLSSIFLKICPVISIKNDFNSPLFHSSNTSPISLLLNPTTNFNISYASAINCISPYSIPLCTIFT
mmetsp:Transcript_39525/g.48916  ORF Transcript_39525/g.48916 Transcript_39525/m.48916 type:complete len:248 (-) Transcript_39525:713-1456(-)